MKRRWRFLFFGIGLAGMAIMLLQVNWSTMDWDQFFNVNVLTLFGMLILIWLAIYSIHTVCYKLILGDEHKKVRFFSMFKICASGFALNNVTPGGLIGGEPYRILELKRYVSTEKATSSTLSFTLVYTLGHFLLWITATVLYIVYGLPGNVGITILMMTAGCLITGGFALFILLRKRGVAYPVMKWLSKLPILRKKLPVVVEKNKESYIEIDENIKKFRTTPVRFVVVIALQYLTRILEGLEYFAILYYFTGGEGTIFDGILIMGVASLIGNIIWIIPMQTSTREIGMVFALSFLMCTQGLPNNELAELAVQIGLVYRVREFLFILFGILLVAFGKRGKKYKEDEQKIEIEEKGAN